MTSIPAPQSLPGPEDISRSAFPNGIVVLARSNFNSPSVYINGSILAGSLFDSDEKLGLANFVAPALMRGTARRSFHEIFESLESVGATLGFSGGTHTTGFHGMSLAEDLDMLLNLLGEVLRQPVFPEEHIERLRAQLLTSLAIRAQDTGDMASMTFDSIVYEGHPYRRPEDGYPETIQAITQADLGEFHRRHYGPKGMIITLVGGMEPAQMIDAVARVLGDWQNPEQPESPALPPVCALDSVTVRRVNIPGKAQSDLVLGVAGPERRSPDYLPASLGNNILGQFGMYGRIGDVVREQEGLAYYAYSSLGGGIGPGPWDVTAGVAPENVERAIELIRAEIGRLITEPVSEAELNDSKANYVGRLPLSLESNAGVAGALLNLERFDLGLDYYQRYSGLINAVTRAEILETARRYLHPDRLGIGVAGPE